MLSRRFSFQEESSSKIATQAASPRWRTAQRSCSLLLKWRKRGTSLTPPPSSDLARGSALNTVPVQGLSRSIQESLACLIGGRRHEPPSDKLRSGRLHASTYPDHRRLG